MFKALREVHYLRRGLALRSRLANLKTDDFVDVIAEAIYIQSAKLTGNILGWDEQGELCHNYYRKLVRETLEEK